MPVPILTQRKSPTERATPACCSPIAIRFTSLSTMTGQPRSWLSASRTGKPSQPGMIGGATGTPSGKRTGPGTPIPAPSNSSASPDDLNLAAMERTCSKTATGPSRTSMGWLMCPRTSSSALVTATSIEVAPMSTPRKRSAGASRMLWERRPPRDAARPSATTSPVSRSRSTSTASFDRERSIWSPSWARELGPPSRSSRSSRAWCAFAGRAVMRLTSPSPPQSASVQRVLATSPWLAFDGNVAATAGGGKKLRRHCRQLSPLSGQRETRPRPVRVSGGARMRWATPRWATSLWATSRARGTSCACAPCGRA